MAEECVYQVVLKDDSAVFFTGLVRDPEDRPIVRFMPEMQTKAENILSSYHAEDATAEVHLETTDEESTDVYESSEAILKAIRTAVENRFTCDLDA